MIVTTTASAARAHQVLIAAGYGDDSFEFNYPVWLGPERGTESAELVAFGRAAPKDMSTAVVTFSTGSVETAFQIARHVAAPYFLVAQDDLLELWVAEISAPRKWRSPMTAGAVAEIADWLRPSAALTAKVGLRQLPLFEIPVNLLAAARSHSADQLSPIVGRALEVANASLPPSRFSDPDKARQQLHWRAARLVVGALTVLVMRDREGQPRASGESPLGRVVRNHPSTFAWVQRSSQQETAVLEQLVDQLGLGISYKSLDPTILSHVYEQALVDEDDRQQLGIHYTPPKLATRILRNLPVELIPPDDRHVLDPSCGSGTLLVAAHDRLRQLQPTDWTDTDRHRDLAVHLHGHDVDPFAVEIARLTLLLHAQPAGNGWQIEKKDTLRQQAHAPAPSIVVTNPPWRYQTGGQRAQAADRFLRRSMKALSPGGLLGILLPGSFLSSVTSAQVRDELLQGFEVFEVWRLPEGTFSTARFSAAVLFARKRDDLGGQGARVVREVNRAELASFLDGEPASLTSLLSESERLHKTFNPPIPHKPTVTLGSIADIRSGAQPLATITDRGEGTPYLNHFADVPCYGLLHKRHLWHVSFPEDFQSGRGAQIIPKKKVLASAARSSSSPWRFRVAIDPIGVAVRNSVRGIAPHDQNDQDLLYALAMIVGSGYASVFAASFGGDRNIPARVLPALPIPKDRAAIQSLAALGRQAVELGNAPSRLSRHLISAEQRVWQAYGISGAERAAAESRLSGQTAPEGLPRYPAPRAYPPVGHSTFRRVGAVLDVKGNTIRIWVNGITADDGTTIPFPARMPGWLARPGATFDVTGVDSIDDLVLARYRLQPMCWQDLDLDRDEPVPLRAR